MAKDAAKQPATTKTRFEKKSPAKQKRRIFKGSAGTAAARRGRERHKNKGKKKAQKAPKPSKRQFKKKSPVKQNPCVFKGLARKSAKAPMAKPQKNKKKQKSEKIQNGLEFFQVFSL